MIVPFVDLKAQYASIKDEIDSAIQSVLDQTAFIGGDIVNAFEESFASYAGLDHCVSCANGTDALEIALEALGIGEGDEVIVPAYTWISTASAVSRVGATPVFVDVDARYYTIDTTLVADKISSRTKCIIPVHFYGLPADMPAIMKIAEEHNLLVVEDCAQSHGASIDGKKVGTYGDVSTFSFYPGKNLGAYGDAGCIVTNNKDLEEKIRALARLGQKGKHNHVAIGRNSRMDTLQAAVLQVKLKYVDKWTEGRRDHADAYGSLMADLPVQLPKSPDGFHHVYHVFMIQVENRDRVRESLRASGISTQLHYPKPITSLPPYQDASGYPVSERMSEKMISLPMFAELTSDQISFVSNKLAEFC